MKPILTLSAAMIGLLCIGCSVHNGLSGTENPQRSKTNDDLTIMESAAVSHLEMKDTERTYRSFTEYVQDRVPGVEVSANGGLIIRGMSTFNGSTDPLILMDGMEIHDIDSINPHDIHSVDVIKDGSAASYGMRGGNGVILITSKAAYLSKEAEKRAKKEARAARKKK